MVSSTWVAKNINAASMMANKSAKNIGATSANCTTASPFRLYRKRRIKLANEAVEAGVGDMGNPRTIISAKDLAETDCGNLARGLARMGPAVNEAFTSVRARPRRRAAHSKAERLKRVTAPCPPRPPYR